MSNGLVGFKDEFIKKLSETYPEKAVFLMGMDFEIVYLIEYIKDNNLTPDTFVPSEFKKYIDSQSSFYQVCRKTSHFRARMNRQFRSKDAKYIFFIQSISQ